MELISYNGHGWRYDVQSNSLCRTGGGGASERRVDCGAFDRVILPYTVETVAELCDGHVRNLTLNLTENCNMRCRYCVACGNFPDERSVSSRRMSFEVARAAIDWLADASRKGKEVGISFFGGEPLLETDLMLKICHYARERMEEKEVRFNLTTNATLVDERILDWLSQDERTTIAITMNGPSDIHDRERMFANGDASHDWVLRGVRSVLKVLRDRSRLTIQCNYRDLPELARQQNWFRLQKALAGVSVLYTGIRLPDPTDGCGRRALEERRNRERVFEEALRRRTVKDAARLKRLPPILQEGDSLLPTFVAMMNKPPMHSTVGHQGVCTPIVSRASVDVAGDLFFCEKSFGTPICGNVLKGGVDGQKLAEHVRLCNQLFERLGCKKCPALFYCRLCAVDFYRRGQLRPLAEIGASCERMRSHFVEDLIWYVSLLEENSKLLRPSDMSRSEVAYVRRISDAAGKAVRKSTEFGWGEK